MKVIQLICSRKTLAIAVNTFREAIRNKILYSVVFFSILTVLGAALFGSVSIGSLSKVVKDFGLFSLSFFGAILSVIAGVSLLNSELKQKTIYNILSKPVSRSQFVIGKYIGLTMTVGLQVILMGLSLIFFLWMIEGKINVLLFEGVLFALFEVILVCAVATFFSAVVVTTTLAALYTCSVYIAGRSITCLDFFATQDVDAPYLVRSIVQIVASVLYYILPDFNVFNITNVIVYGEALPFSQVIASFTYSVTYSILLLLAGVVIFERREFA